MTKRNIAVTLDMLKQRFDKPLCDVAKELGVCMTFIKKACRKHGIKRWPYRKVQAMINRQERARHRAAAADAQLPGAAPTPVVIPTIPLSGENPFLASVSATPVVQLTMVPPSSSTDPPSTWMPRSSSPLELSSSVTVQAQLVTRERCGSDASMSVDGNYSTPILPTSAPLSSSSSILAGCEESPQLSCRTGAANAVPALSTSMESGRLSPSSISRDSLDSALSAGGIPLVTKATMSATAAATDEQRESVPWDPKPRESVPWDPKPQGRLLDIGELDLLDEVFDADFLGMGMEAAAIMV